MTGEQKERPEREGLWGIGQGWHWQGEYLSRHWHPVSPTEPELVRFFGFLHWEVEPTPLKICTGNNIFTMQSFTVPPLSEDVTWCWTVNHFTSGRVMIPNVYSPASYDTIKERKIYVYTNIHSSIIYNSEQL